MQYACKLKARKQVILAAFCFSGKNKVASFIKTAVHVEILAPERRTGFVFTHVLLSKQQDSIMSV